MRSTHDQFQPTPRFVNEGNQITSLKVTLADVEFQPTPRFVNEGNLLARVLLRRCDQVSTHPSLRQRGELEAKVVADAPGVVSTHPSLRQRGEPSRPPRRRSGRRCFNPPLASSTRGTTRPPVNWPAEMRFQPTPRFVNEGNAVAVDMNYPLLVVSTHPSLRQRGEPPLVVDFASCCSWFQPTPRFVNEGNLILGGGDLPVLFVSTHPSLRQRGELGRQGRRPNRDGFNPPLASSTRGTFAGRPERSPGLVSTHPSLRQRGEPLAFDDCLADDIVSTHPSLRQRGELRRGQPPGPIPVGFNPPLASSTRGTRVERPLLRPALGFNPPLASSTRGTSSSLAGVGSLGLFQPTPRFVNEGNAVRPRIVTASASFNPPLASSTRGTELQSAEQLVDLVSTHPSLRQRGEPIEGRLAAKSFPVSTHPSLRQRGERVGKPFDLEEWQVSTHPSLRQRGEREFASGSVVIGKVSTHPSLRQRGELHGPDRLP